MDDPINFMGSDIQSIPAPGKYFDEFPTVFRHAPVAVFQSTHDGQLIHANYAMAEMLGYDSPEQLIACVNRTNIADCLYARPENRNQLIGQAAGKDNWILAETQFKRKDGKIIEANMYFRSFLDPNRRESMVEGFLENLSGSIQPAGMELAAKELEYRQSLEEMVRQRTRDYEASEKKYRHLVETLQEGIWVIDAEGRTTFVNEAMARILGYPVEEIMGRHLFSFMDESMVARAQKYMERRAAGIQEQHYFEFLRSDGQKVYTTLETSPLYDEQGNYQGALAGVIDLSHRKRAEDMLLRKNQELENSRALLMATIKRKEQYEKELVRAKIEAEGANRSKSQLLANVSHEIRNPLHAVIGFSEILPSLVSEPDALKYIGAISKAAKSLLKIVNDILDISKIEAGKMEAEYTSSNPHSILKEISQIFMHEALDKNLSFELKMAPDMPEALMLDELRFRQVLYNLIGNAVKFTVEGGIVVDARLEHDESPGSERMNLVICVTDTGMGIAPEDQGRIFDSFVQISGQANYMKFGTGLGLAISKHLAEIMNGEIKLWSIPGQGSAFTLYLYDVQPALVTDHSGTEDQTLYTAELPVLVVDDSEANLLLARAHLEKLGLNVEVCSSGAECLELVTRKNYSLVLMDCLMPEMNGWETAGRLREWELEQNRGHRTPVIAMTAVSDAEAVELCLAAGLDGHISKPFVFDDLRQILDKWLISSHNPPFPVHMSK